MYMSHGLHALLKLTNCLNFAQLKSFIIRVLGALLIFWIHSTICLYLFFDLNILSVEN